MKQTLLRILFAMALMPLMQLSAQSFPTISTADAEVYYLIRFLNGGNAFTATTSGAQISTSAATGQDSQLWKVEGNDADGYTFTNKLGLQLHAASSAKNTMVKASTNASGTSRFKIVTTKNNTYTGHYEVQPVGNSAVSMNLFGGPSENRGVGFWDAADPNNPVRFQAESEFKSLGSISVVPYPSQLTVVKDGKADFAKFTTITYTDELVRKHVESFATQWTKASGKTLTIKETPATPETNSIHLSVDTEQPAEGYTLQVTDNGIRITASEAAGFFYALQTLKQLLPHQYFAESVQQVEWTLPYVEINDRPHLGHRGYMLDIARHFFNKEEVKRVLDIMAFYKMNRFHWHLTDDQGWRIEIPEYPRLTEVGAIRKGSFSNPGDGRQFYDDTEYGRGMWYSLDDLREVVAYAAERHIEIIPEVDLPGHMVAAVASYPEFSCDPSKEYEVRIDGGISHDVLNIGKDEVIDFLKCVLGHVATIFPYQYVHIGGDECPTEQWSNNADCLRRVQEEGLSGVNELQSWLVELLGNYLKNEYGKDLVVWDELLAHWSSQNTVKPVVMAWNSIDKSREAANKGMKSIVVPYNQLYLDFMQVPVSQRFVDEPYNGGWGDSFVNTVEEVYNINPLEALGGKEEYCLGVQGNMWTETTNDIGEVEYQLLPRLLALSETGWLPAAQKNWDDFYARLQRQDEILDALGYTYAKHYIIPEEKSALEANIDEAEKILNQSIRGGVGYPEDIYYDVLEMSLEEAKINTNDETAAEMLDEALKAYKEAPIVQPQPGKTYQIVSASTYYKQQYAGSTVYADGTNVRFHYTPQVEPEELWTFEGTNGEYVLRNLCTGKALQMPSINSAVTLVNENPTPIRVDKATIATGQYTYLPGVVTLSAAAGYKENVTGSVKRMHGELTGLVHAKDVAALCYPGTWYLVEVIDYAAWLQGLCNKCNLILLTAEPGKVGEPTESALDYLQNEVLTPAKAAIEAGNVSEETYREYMERYNAFLLMERTSALDGLSEEYFYRIRNVWFNNYYATGNATAKRVEPKAKSDNDNQLWFIQKNDDGTVCFFNKATKTGAYIASDATDQTVKLGKPYGWTLEERTLDGQTGICIIDRSGENSWYTNPNSWGYLLMKPFWGAATWSFERTNIETTGITHLDADGNEAEGIRLYDVSGRSVATPGHGIYITNTGKKICK
ncbi:MAG: family 20 glycosylhydrolase [Bacteroidaceae bacterium]|nr:family 20 glycosylhydrolase [Bacteroidaceae bacterium]